MSRSKNPLITIYTPTYNRGYCIGRTIDSVLAQDYDNWEYLIIDDGSTDNTEEIVMEYVKKDNRIKYRKDTNNQGHLARALEGERWCHGDLSARLDSDDYFDDGVFKTLVQLFIINNDIEAFCFVARNEKTGKVLYDVNEPIIFSLEDIVNMKVPNIDVVAFLSRIFLDKKMSLCSEPYHIITSPLETFYKYNFKEMLVPKKYVTFGWGGDNMTIVQTNKKTLLNNYLASKYSYVNIKTDNKKFNEMLFINYITQMNNLSIRKSLKAKFLALINLKFVLFIKLIIPRYIKSKIKSIKGR